MRFRCPWAAAILAAMVFVEHTDAAIITAAGGKKAKTSGVAKVTTTTSGQRRIAITIDPDVATAFRLDVLYEDKWLTPVNFDGINPGLAPEAIDYVAPYAAVGGGGGGASILPGAAGPPGTGGLISNVEGRYSFGPTLGPPVPNRPDGGSDLFTLFFIDNAPQEDKVFVVLGFDAKGVSSQFAHYVSDNYIEALITDPNDPSFGQIVRIAGEDIEESRIFVPGVGSGSGAVPLPPAAWAGLIGAAMVGLTRSRFARRTAIDK